MSDFDLPGNARQALGNSGLDQASSAAKHHNKEGQPDLSGLTVADTRKCSYAMQLFETSLAKLPGEKVHPEQAEWVWPIWRCADLAVGKNDCERWETMACGQKLLQAVERLHEWRAIRDELFDSLSSRAEHKSFNAIHLNVQHAFDCRYVIVKLEHQRKAEARGRATEVVKTLQSVIKWFDDLITSNGESFKSAYEKAYGAPRLRHASTTGHIPIVLGHRPRLSSSGASHAPVFSDDEGREAPDKDDGGGIPTDEDDDDDDEVNAGLTLTRTSSRRPSPPPRSRSAERSLGREGTYRMRRRYFARAYAY